MEKDTRPVRCYICGRKMYYAGHPKHEKEYELQTDRTTGYIHASCIKFLKQKRKEESSQ